MQLRAESITSTAFENLYDTYSPMLFGIAIQISPNKKVAEQILISTFKKIHQQRPPLNNSKSLCVALIKLMIQTGIEQFRLKESIKLRQFENSPLLHKIFCEMISLENICEQNYLTREQASKKIREEFNSIREIQNGKMIAV